MRRQRTRVRFPAAPPTNRDRLARRTFDTTAATRQADCVHRDLYDEHARIVRLLGRIRSAVEAVVHPLSVSWRELEGEPVPFADAVSHPFRAGEAGMRWGPPWSTVWFRFTGEVPEHLRGKRLELVVDLGFSDASPGFQAEGLAYRLDGHVLKGVEPRTTYVPIHPGAGTVDVYVEAAANPTLQGF